MAKNNKYATLVEATERLKARGFSADFDVTDDCRMEVLDLEGSYSCDQVKIIEFHRFEGMSDPSDMAIIYALETTDGRKGTIVDAYGSDSSMRIGDFIKKVESRANDE